MTKIYEDKFVSILNIYSIYYLLGIYVLINHQILPYNIYKPIKIFPKSENKCQWKLTHHRQPAPTIPSYP